VIGTNNGRFGPLALVGSGEYTPAMDDVDRQLLELCEGKTVLLIATACAPEGIDVMERWEEMGRAHFARLGVKAAPLRIRNAEDANQREAAATIAQADFVWFSGGSATYLAQALDGTASWEALAGANARGAVVAGSSGGLGVLNAHVLGAVGPGPNVRPDGPNGLGLAAPIRAIPHFDRFEARRPEMVDQMRARLMEGQTLIGVDEDTACIWMSGAWVAWGRGRVNVFGKEGERAIYRHGETVPLPKPLRNTG
jgi:cyanophycinase